MACVNQRRRILIQTTAISAISTLTGCGGSPSPPPPPPTPPPPSTNTYALGWSAASAETYAGISQLNALSFAAVSTQSTSTTAVSLDLSNAAALALQGWPTMLPTPGDQGGQGSCVAWGVAYAAATSSGVVAGLGDATNPARIGSPADLYAKLMRRETRNTCGNGTIIKDAMDIMVEEGVLSHAQVGYSDQGCVAPSNGGLMFLDGYAKLAITDREGIKRALQGFHVLPFGMRVYNDFFSAGQGIYNGPTAGTTDVGGHCMVIIGYDDSTGCYKVQNSWGTLWGDAGLVRISYVAFERLASELYSPFQYSASLPNHLYDQSDASGAGRVRGVYGNVNLAREGALGPYTATLSFKLNEYLRVAGYNLVLWTPNGVGGFMPTVIADNRSVQSLRGGAFTVSNLSPDLIATSQIASINFGATDRNGVVTQISLFLTMTRGR